MYTLTFIVVASLAAYAQEVQKSNIQGVAHDQSYSYAYVLVKGKAFSKKLNVEVDFGDTPDQIKIGKEYSDTLTDKKSYAAILNYMVESQFELVETLDYMNTFEGSGGTYGIAFIMRKKR